MTLTLPRIGIKPQAEPEAPPKKPRMYPSLLEAFDKGREIAPVPSKGMFHNPVRRSACAWGAISLGWGHREENNGGPWGYGPKGVGGLRLIDLHLPAPSDYVTNRGCNLRNTVMTLNDTAGWSDSQFRSWLRVVDMAIEEHIG